MQTEFLQRMLRNLVKVSDKLSYVLGRIDDLLWIEYPNILLVSLKPFIVGTPEILTPSELRQMKKSSDEDGAIEDPKVYHNPFINVEDFI
uniref:PRC domain-containing protein n=2 Tax=Caenorhabditis tropicalis TaxID=1561998 RepID=A0A1I7UGF7_9PELO